jgi:hypothetical protein
MKVRPRHTAIRLLGARTLVPIHATGEDAARLAASMKGAPHLLVVRPGVGAHFTNPG